MELQPDTVDVLRLFRAGKTAEGQELAAKALEGLKRRLREIEWKVEILEKLVPHTPDQGKLVNVAIEAGPATKAERKIAILNAAKEVASQTPSHRVTTDAVVEFLKERGITPPRKTAVGIILGSASGWKRLERGVYSPTTT